MQVRLDEEVYYEGQIVCFRSIFAFLLTALFLNMLSGLIKKKPSATAFVFNMLSGLAFD